MFCFKYSRGLSIVPNLKSVVNAISSDTFGVTHNKQMKETAPTEIDQSFVHSFN